MEKNSETTDATNVQQSLSEDLIVKAQPTESTTSNTFTATSNTSAAITTTTTPTSTSHPKGNTATTTTIEKEIKMDRSKASYDDLDELHLDLLDEREQHDINESMQKSSTCCCMPWCCFFKKEKKPKLPDSDWLKHFRVVVRNNRFITNSWSGGLFSIIQQRFEKYQHAESEAAELHVSAHNSIQEFKRMMNSSQNHSSITLSTSPRTTTNNNAPGGSNSKLTNQTDPSTDSLKQLRLVIQNSIILEEEIENIRDSLRHQDIIDYFTSPSDQQNDQQQQYQYSPPDQNQHSPIPFVNHLIIPTVENSNNTAGNDRRNSSAIHERNRSHQQGNQKKLDSLTRSINIVSTRDSGRQHAPVRLDSQQQSAIRESSRDMRLSYQTRNQSIKSNTLLIDSAALADKDKELYQAAIYYKTITVIIESHLKPTDAHSEQKPLRVLRDNFIDFYVNKYAQNLQSLAECQIVEGITDLKEFLTLFLEVIREYYKLDELVNHCPHADRFMTTDNLINFLCALVFADDSIYSIVYVSHTHFEKALSLRYFHTIKEIYSTIQLAQLKVQQEYRLDLSTLQKMLKQNAVSINDSMLIDAPVKIAPPFFKAIDHFKTISHYRSPLHKLKVIIKTQELINQSIRDFYDCFNIDYSDIFYDADTLIGIFSYILVKSCVYDVIAHCKIIENFATKSTLNSQSGYLLVTLQCCITFIASIDPAIFHQEQKALADEEHNNNHKP